jgi:transposase
LSLELVLRGILTVLSQGCKWRAIDRPEAAWNSLYQYYRRWTREGVWTQLFSAIERPLVGTRRFLDSTHVKVHRGASNPRGGQASQAMGRTKGGMNTKLHAVVDEAAQPGRLFLSAGHEADLSHAQTMVEEIPGALLVGDKGYDSDPFRQWLRERGLEPCIPPRSNRKSPTPYRKPSYRKRPVVENFLERRKNFRRVSTRYDKLAETYLGFVCLASLIVSLLFRVCKHALNSNGTLDRLRLPW